MNVIKAFCPRSIIYSPSCPININVIFIQLVNTTTTNYKNILPLATLKKIYIRKIGIVFSSFMWFFFFFIFYEKI